MANEALGRGAFEGPQPQPLTTKAFTTSYELSLLQDRCCMHQLSVLVLAIAIDRLDWIFYAHHF
jgi:hypothetical protein